MTDQQTRKHYSGISLFGVPLLAIDIRYASELLYETYTRNGKSVEDAMESLLGNNEKVVSRCGMLISF